MTSIRFMIVLNTVQFNLGFTIDIGDFDSNYRILKQQLLAIDPTYA